MTIPLLLAAVLAVLSPALEECVDCLWTEKKVTLCKRHKSGDKSTLGKAKRAIKSDDPGARLAAYELVASLTAAHANAPSPEVAEFLAQGLLDDDYETVTRGVLDLMLEGQHPGAVIEGLGVAVEELGERMKRASSTDVEAQIRLVTEEIDRGSELFRALGKFRDERALEVLASYLDQKPDNLGQVFTIEASNAALGYNSVESSELVIDTLKRVQKKKRYTGITDNVCTVLMSWAKAKGGAMPPPPCEKLDVKDWMAWVEAQPSLTEPLGRLDTPITASIRDGARSTKQIQRQ